MNNLMNVVGVWYEFRGEEKFVVVSEDHYQSDSFNEIILPDYLEEYGVHKAMIDRREIKYQSLPVDELMMGADRSHGDDEFADESLDKLLDYLFGDQTNHQDRSIFF